MEVSIDQDAPPPRKRRKTEGDIPMSHFWFGRGTGVTKCGVGLLQPFTQATNPHIDSTSLNLPTIVLSPAKPTMQQLFPDAGKGLQSWRPHMIHMDPHSVARFARTPSNRKSMVLKQHQESAILPCDDDNPTQKSLTVDTASNLLVPPRVHIRSSSAFPELSDIHPDSISAAAQFEKRRRVNSQPTLTNGAGTSPHKHTPYIGTSGVLDRSPRPSDDHSSETSSERAPLLSRSRRHDSGMNASQSQKHRSLGLATDDGVNETLQHIGKGKFLWFVAIAILVGIFLILFLYAFHILR